MDCVAVTVRHGHGASEGSCFYFNFPLTQGNRDGAAAASKVWSRRDCRKALVTRAAEYWSSAIRS
jgi:hypothetical protein